MQNNWLSGIVRRISALNVAALFLLATLAPTVTSVLTAQKVDAMPATNVVINEIFPSPSGGDEWVEFYNPTASTVSLDNWKLRKESGSQTKDLSGTIAAGGFFVLTVSPGSYLPNGGTTVYLNDGSSDVDQITYSNQLGDKSYARTTDAEDSWEERTGSGITENASNNLVVSTAELNAEEFVAHSGTNYKGISVGFNVKNFGTVTAVSVAMERADGSIVTKTGNQGVFDLISNKTTRQQLTAPFVIQEGTFTEASDTMYWNPAPATWNANTTPVKVIINVTDEHGTRTIENANFNQGAPSWPVYFSLLPTATSTEIITANTASGENQPGWLFNRDSGTSTPYEFNANEKSIGAGSLNVLPIGTNPSDKFIAENFILSPVAHVNQISYDFKIGAGGSTSDANEFYMNVYANFGESSPTKFYDCRYNVVPVSGSTTNFTTVTFDPSQSYPVATSGSSPYACPASPAAMDNLSNGSTIRVFTLNVGDTSANDAGLDGYLDNVVVDKIGEVKTYDLEPDTTPPAKPQMLGIYKGHNSSQANFLGCDGVTPTNQIRIDWADNTENDIDYYWLGVAGNPKHKKVYAKSYYDGSMTPGKASYYYTVIAVDKNGNESEISESCALKLDQTPPQVELTAPASDSVLDGTVIISGKVVDDNPSHYYLVVKDESGVVVAGPGVVYAPDVVDYEWDTTSLANGTYSILLSAKDKAGNKDNINLSVDNITITVQNVEDGDNGGNGAGHGGGSVVDDDGQVTVTVVSSATDQDVQTEPNQNQDQVLGTTTEDDDQTAEDETEVLAENEDQNGQADGEPQEEVTAEDDSNIWWWILGFVLLLFLLYLIFRRKKNKSDQE